MRSNPRRLLSLLLAGSSMVLLLTGCLKDRVTKTYKIYTPIYTAISTIVANINGNPGQAFDSIGRIYVKDKYIFLSERGKGIHILDNSDPTHPASVGFLNIPGNQSMTVKGNILYADMHQDLLAIDISDPHRAHVVSIVYNLYQVYWSLNGMSWYGGVRGDSSLIVTGWTIKDTTVVVNPSPLVYYDRGYLLIAPAVAGATAMPAATITPGESAGTGGSMASMTLINNYLYAITSSHNVGIVDVSNPAAPGKLSLDYVSGFDLETIFPFEDKLFLGSTEGVYILDISNPAKPVQTGQFQHGRACDPVITDGSYAYVTLHAGTPCGGASNELDVLNVQDLQQPRLIDTYPMTSPGGLCKDGNLLFVCDNPGVKLYDATNPASLQLLTSINTGDAYDVIAANHLLLVVTKKGLYQYDYSNTRQINRLSFFRMK